MRLGTFDCEGDGAASIVESVDSIEIFVEVIFLLDEAVLDELGVVDRGIAKASLLILEVTTGVGILLQDKKTIESQDMVSLCDF